MSQGDSVYDIIDTSDHLIMRTNLATPTSLEMGKKQKMLTQQIEHFFFYVVYSVYSNPHFVC